MFNMGEGVDSTGYTPCDPFVLICGVVIFAADLKKNSDAVSFLINVA